MSATARMLQTLLSAKGGPRKRKGATPAAAGPSKKKKTGTKRPTTSRGTDGQQGPEGELAGNGRADEEELAAGAAEAACTETEKKKKKKKQQKQAEATPSDDDAPPDPEETLALLKKLPKSMLKHADPTWLALMRSRVQDSSALAVADDEPDTPEPADDDEE
ncbi:hypothetical protein DIPPA_22808 [Diplonema papillatum]|nr:hypothetical protein DIPPA_04820 [Diplonema papillatum]KAJ9436093.1 hypothetical protein DIPPA_22808 [Diplonema papillatum]